MSVDVGATTSTSVLDQFKIKEPTKTKELGKDQFLELLVAQMNNQNPLDPQSNTEYVAQLAQFSSLESLKNLNDSMTNLVASTQSSQALQASSLVGRKVMVPTSKAVVDPAEGLTGTVSLTSSTSNLYVNVLDEKGNTVNRVNLGAQKAGAVSFTWDGKDSSGNAVAKGTYTFKAEAGVDGKTVAMGTVLPANVDSVTLGQNGGEMTLNLAGLGSIALSKVQVIGK